MDVLKKAQRPPFRALAAVALIAAFSRDPSASGAVTEVVEKTRPAAAAQLTPVGRLAGRFGATEQDCQAVSDWARAHNLTVTATHPNRIILDVEGAVADIESAFKVVLR